MTSGLYDQSYPPSVFVPPGPIQAVGAVAGTPGHYVPAGAVPPATSAAFLAANLLASPLTTWTVGQYVAAGDGTHFGWTGFDWAPAAADDEAEDEE